MTTTVAPVDFDGSVAWREAGSGAEAILFLHGLALTRTSWDEQLVSLADSFRCVAWDMPGYGASAPVAELTFDAIAESVVALLDRLDLAKAHLVGLSFGGMHALHTALRYPDRVDRMVLFATSPAFGLDGTDPDEWRRLRLDPLDRGLAPTDMAVDVLTTVGGSGVGGDSLDAMIASMARISAAGLRAAVECLTSHDVRDRLGEITAPTLVVVGELDSETPVVYSELLADAMPGARLEVLPGIGHLAPVESPATATELIRSHLTAPPGDPSP